MGSGGFSHQSSKETMDRRLSRLTEEEQREVQRAMESLDLPKLSELFSKSDSFDPITYETNVIEIQKDLHKKVWDEVVELRKSGELINRVAMCNCPVIAIHGDFDPHPAEGVKLPLEKILKNFSFVELNRCGHTPWIERYARDEFFSILKKEA